MDENFGCSRTQKMEQDGLGFWFFKDCFSKVVFQGYGFSLVFSKVVFQGLFFKDTDSSLVFWILDRSAADGLF